MNKYLAWIRTRQDTSWTVGLSTAIKSTICLHDTPHLITSTAHGLFSFSHTQKLKINKSLKSLESTVEETMQQTDMV